MTDRRYETLVLLHPDLGEAGSHEQVSRVKTLMEDKGANVATCHEWGQRDLAYPVREQRRAIFALFEYRTSPATLAEIERNLRLMDPVLRFVSVRREEDAPAATELRTMEARWTGDGAGRGRDRDRERFGFDARDRRGAEAGAGEDVERMGDGEGDDDGRMLAEEGV